MVTKNCIQCGNSFEISSGELELYKKFEIPPEEICFKCSQMQRLTFRNERCIYSRKCDFSGEDIISIYSPDKPYKVYKSKYWYGDKWDAMEFGRNFDFNRPFFEQLKELQLDVPRLALINAKAENSDYCNMTWSNKNCYLVFGGDYNEDVQYGTLCMHNRDCFDVDFSDRNEVCYYMNDSNNCYGCHYTFDSHNCTDCFFVSDLIGCDNCILCTNLVKKSYYVENKKVSKEEFEEKKEELMNGSLSQMKENLLKLKELRKKRIVKYYHGINTENCKGDYINNSKNCINCFDVDDGEDLRNGILIPYSKDLFNCCYTGHKMESSYGTVATVNSHYIRNSYFVFDSSNIDYSEQIVGCENLLGCIGLRHKKNCILNKQYSEKDFAATRDRIIDHMKKTDEWGKFLPKDLSCFAYNEGTSHQYFPLSNEQALAYGFTWKEPDKREYKKTTFKAPDNIKDVSDAIVDKILACSDCGRNYKINNTELKFYRRFNIPVPLKCSECRHRERLDMRNPVVLYDRSCQCDHKEHENHKGKHCEVKFQTTYAPDRSEKIYCEQCYLKEVV